MVDGYGTVTQDLIDQHAKKVDDKVNTKVRTAVDAVQQVEGKDDEMYGKILKHLIPPVIEACTGDGKSAMNGMIDVGEKLTDALRKAEKDYDNTRKASLDLINKIGD